MKRGMNPTRKHRGRTGALGPRSEAWTVAKNLPDKLIVVHRETGRTKKVQK